jgi:hypothetical protein
MRGYDAVAELHGATGKRAIGGQRAVVVKGEEQWDVAIG